MSIETGAGPVPVAVTSTAASSTSTSTPLLRRPSQQQRRKRSRQYRFSVDYIGFPRIDDESEEEDSSSDPNSGCNANNNAGSPFRRRTGRRKRLLTMEDLDQIRGNRFLQYLATFAANMGAFAFGTALSYPAVALPDLRKDPHFSHIMTELDESWIGSVFALGAVVSGPAAGYAIERMGRRMSMLVLSVPFFLSWMLINIASDIPMVIIGRFLTGFFSGVFLVAAPIFTAEIADVSIRGAVGATFDMSSSVGILFIYIIGTYCSWRTQALICATIPLFIFLLMLFVPESPAYLLEKGKRVAAKDALVKYKGFKNNPDSIQALLDNLHQEVVDSKASESASLCDLLTPHILIPVSIAFMVFVFQVICGLDPILVYTVDIFKSAGGPNGTSGPIDEYTSTVVFGVIELAAGVVAAFFVDKTGRRFLLLISEAVMVLSLTALGIYFYLRNDIIGPTPIPPTGQPTINGLIDSTPILSWLPLVSLSVFILAYSVGLGPVGYLLMGEILPLRVKGLAGSLLTSAKWLLSFVVTRFFDDLISVLGESGCFWLFAGFCALGYFCVLWFVPETNGKSLEDIQRDFRKRFSVLHQGDPPEAEPLLPPNHAAIKINGTPEVANNSSPNNFGSGGGDNNRQPLAVPLSLGYQSINSAV